jgi:hypothetical protein
MASEVFVLTADDEALVDRLAARIVEMRLEVPAVLALESGRPLSLIASQAMIFFEPLVQSIFHMTDYRRFALLAEHREAVECLLRRIEARAEEARQAKRTTARTGPTGSPRP